MASTPHWTEWNVNSTSTTGTRADINWKAVDDSTTTAYTASPITAGNRSMVKLQALAFDSGSWNNLSAFGYSASRQTDVSGAISLYGNTVSGFTAPTSTTTLDSTLMITTSPGISANFTTGYANEWTAGTSTIAGSSTQPVVAQALRTQLLTATSAPPGDMTTIGITATWTES